jgi:hypothetical protein
VRGRQLVIVYRATSAKMCRFLLRSSSVRLPFTNRIFVMRALLSIRRVVCRGSCRSRLCRLHRQPAAAIGRFEARALKRTERTVAALRSEASQAEARVSPNRP